MGRCQGMFCALLLAGCTPSAIEDDEPDNTGLEESSGSEAIHERNDGVAIEGLMGTISQMAVQRGIEPKMGRFLACFTRRYGQVELLGGHIEMAFRVHTDGAVRWVYPRASTIGDRETERCLLETASSIQFSRPAGGEAEFSYPLDLDPPEDVRPPLEWDATRVAAEVESNASTVAACGHGFSVTAYVDRGGRVLAVGASTSQQENAVNLDCVASAVSQWTMPDPGSYPAKVTFSL